MSQGFFSIQQTADLPRQRKVIQNRARRAAAPVA